MYWSLLRIDCHLLSFCHETNIFSLFLATCKYLCTKMWIWLFGSVLSMFHVNVKQMNNHEQNWGRRLLIGGICRTSTLRNKGHDEWHGHFQHDKRSKPGISRRLEPRGWRDTRHSSVGVTYLVSS